MPEAKPGPVPELRFPEFREAGPWEVKRLGEIAEINPSTGPLPPNFVYIDLESVVGGELVQKKHISRKGAPSRAQRVLKVGDVIYQMVRPYQMNNLLFEMDDGQEYVASTGYAQLRAEGSSTFLYQLIHTTPFTNSVLEKCTGSNYPAISSSDLADLRTRVPALPEQQKIADCLTALDDLIRAEEGRLEALRAHKTGLMQRLFPAPGQTTPRLRFPEFQNAGPWEVKRLGEIYRFKPTNSWPRDRLNYDGGTVKNIHYGDIHKGLSATFCIANEVVPFLDPVLAASVNDEALCEPGDIVLADASEDVTDIGKAIEIVEIGDQKLVSGLHTILVSQIEPKVVVGFGAYLFASTGIRTQIQRRAQGAKVLGISKSELAEIGLTYPRAKAEQQKIADCLTALDELILAQGETIEALKTHKRGLMQKLFPREVG